MAYSDMYSDACAPNAQAVRMSPAKSSTQNATTIVHTQAHFAIHHVQRLPEATTPRYPAPRRSARGYSNVAANSTANEKNHGNVMVSGLPCMSNHRSTGLAN